MALRPARSILVAIAVACGSALVLAQDAGNAGQGDDDGFRFRAGVDLVNVAVTVTDAEGRFVTGLRQDDFTVYEDDEPQAISHFSAERVPVSLGIALDTSSSMAGEKFDHAEQALDRFLNDLLDPDDEVFLYRFSSEPVLEEGWTTDRQRLMRALRRIAPRGGTAMYDAVADAVPLAREGRNRKKALLIISDGNDTGSQTTLMDVRDLIRDSEMLVYAVGIDGENQRVDPWPRAPRPPIRIPWPFPGGPGGRGRPFPQPPVGGGSPRGSWGQSDARVNVAALRELTDDSGGRTEIVRSSRDLDPATESIASELSQQYFLAYPAAAHKDGRWHTIRVEVKNGRYHVRARRGYMAT